MTGKIRDQLLYKLSEIQWTLAKHNKSSLSNSDFIVLNIIDKYGKRISSEVKALKMSELIKALNLNKTKLTKICTKLEERGYVEKFNDQYDRRAKYLIITKKGQQILKTEGKTVYDVADSLISDLNEGDTAYLLHLLDTLSDAIKKSQKTKIATKV